MKYFFTLVRRAVYTEHMRKSFSTVFALQPVLLRFLPLLATFAFFAVLLLGVRVHSHSIYFQDENEHVAIGWAMTEFQKVLYRDLSTNHQPIPILLGAISAHLTPYQTFFQFIDRLRLSMWAFALLASLLIVSRFHWRGFWAVASTYSVGFFYFAWYLLAEPVAVPAVLWILLLLWEKRWSRWDALSLGSAAFWITFTLVPLWPFVLISGLWGVWRERHNKKNISAIFLGGLLPTGALFCIVPFFSWWQETVINNVRYFIPYEGQHGSWHYLTLLTYPLWHLGSLGSPTSRFIVASTLLGGLAGLSLCRSFSVRKHWLTCVVFGILLFSLNLRTSDVNVVFYWGFHLFPYIAGLGVVLSLSGQQLYRQANQVKKSQVLACLVIIGGGVILAQNLMWVSEKKDRLTEYFIQYDRFQAYATALKTLSSPGDTLMTGPDGAGYLNMLAGLPFAGKQNFHLEWAWRVPELRQSWLTMIEQEPPTFLYYHLNTDSYSQVLRPLVETEYVPLYRKDGSETGLRMHKKALAKIQEDQWQRFEEQAFQRPSALPF